MREFGEPHSDFDAQGCLSLVSNQQSYTLGLLLSIMPSSRQVTTRLQRQATLDLCIRELAVRRPTLLSNARI